MTDADSAGAHLADADHGCLAGRAVTRQRRIITSQTPRSGITENGPGTGLDQDGYSSLNRAGTGGSGRRQTRG